MSIPSSVGRYRIDRVLGSGAFASVWLGHDDALASPVAIKVLSGSMLDDLDVRNRFLEEARILRRADSERLVRVHDIGELPDGRPYFVMSYADRGTLADRMRERPLPVAECLRLAEEIARGIQVINQLGVIHRDIKPSNVLFQSAPHGGERLLIADLGLAKAIAHASGAFTLPVGTPGYMSPEQARFGGGLDVRADVYGLGALAYHMLTGKAPGPAPVKKRPSEVRPELTPELDQAILRAMEVDRENRWSTAEAFAQALASLRATTPAGPSPAGPTVLEPPGTPAPADEPVAGPREEAPRRPPAGEHPTPPDAEQPRRPSYGDPAGATYVEPYGGPDGRVPPQGGPAGRPPAQGRPAENEPATTPDYPSRRRPAAQEEADYERTAQVPLPPGAQRGGPSSPPDEARTAVDQPQPFPSRGQAPPPGDDSGDDRTVAISRDQFPAQQPPPGGGREGATALYPRPQDAGGPTPGPPGPFPPPGVPVPGGPVPGGPAPAQGGRPAGGDKMRKRMIAVAIGAGIVVLALVGGLLLGRLGSGDKPKAPSTPTLPAGFVTVADSTGRIRAAVPKEWPELSQPTTWQPSQVGLADTQNRPVLRAASGSFEQFRDSNAKIPGVFIGLTTDVAQGKLPPPSASVHNQCTKGRPERYTSPDKALTGTITRYTACTSGTPSITEVGLLDRTGNFGAWIRVKEVDNRRVTNDILDNLKLTAP